MTLESMFYISQTVAALAIVVSLLFVGMEVRRSNRESRLRTIEEALQNYRAARLSLIDNADVARAWISGLHDFTALDPVDKVRFLLTADSFFNNVQSFFLHHLEGGPVRCTSPNGRFWMTTSAIRVSKQPGISVRTTSMSRFERRWSRESPPFAAPDWSPHFMGKRDRLAVPERRSRKGQQAAGGHYRPFGNVGFQAADASDTSVGRAYELLPRNWTT